MKVAIVHEWFVDYSGSERVTEELLNIFPDATLFALIEFLPDNLREHIHHKKVTTSFIQKLPFARKYYKSYLPFMPLAVEQLDVSGFDVVISSSHAVAKGVITSANQLHICYCHSPIRYAWDLYHQYISETGLKTGFKGMIAKFILHYIRLWDFTTANRVDHFIANSKYISRRIKKVYNKEATVIYPPVAVNKFSCAAKKEDFYLTASRLVPYKRIDLIVEAFTQIPDKKLYVIGEGPEYDKIRAKATANIVIMGYQPFKVLKDYLERAKAFVFAAEEDFGIAPVEAQACGTPVIAYGKGGALETVTPETGILFQQQNIESIIAAVMEFENSNGRFDGNKIRDNANIYSGERFRKQMKEFVIQQYDNFKS